MKRISLTLSTAAVKRHIIRAAAKCALAKIILLLTCALVYALFVLHRAALANMEIQRRICQAVEYAGRYMFCSRNSDVRGDFRNSGEPRGPGPQLRSTKREKAEGHKKLHIQIRWIWPWIEESCKVNEQVRRTKMECAWLGDKELLSLLSVNYGPECVMSLKPSISLRWQCWPVVGRKIGFTSSDEVHKKSSSLSILMSYAFGMLSPTFGKSMSDSAIEYQLVATKTRQRSNTRHTEHWRKANSFQSQRRRIQSGDDRCKFGRRQKKRPMP